MKTDFLDELLEDFSAKKLDSQLTESVRVLKMLKQKFGCERPVRALYEIKRKIRTGRERDITASNIKRWGKAVS